MFGARATSAAARGDDARVVGEEQIAARVELEDQVRAVLA